MSDEWARLRWGRDVQITGYANANDNLATDSIDLRPIVNCAYELVNDL